MRTSTALFLLVIGLASCCFPPRLYAATPGSDAGEEVPPHRRLHLGLWTVHFRNLERAPQNNWLLGVAMGKVYGATFVNTFGDRAYSAGVQDVLARWGEGRVSVELGYRLGLITGYDERFLRIAGKTPVIPFAQPRLSIESQRIGVELTYSGVVASAGITVPF